MVKPFKPSIQEINFFLAAVLVTAAGYTAYSRAFSLDTAAFYLGISLLVLLTRELGQRSVAQAMNADVELELSIKGSLVTVLGAFIAFVSSLPFILLFPVQNSFSTKSYEQWGKSVDAIWLKRRYWLVSGGIIFMFGLWALTYFLGLERAAEAVSLFVLFQLMPFDYPDIPTGKLDGATILRQSGFTWVLYFGITWLTLALVWV